MSLVWMLSACLTQLYQPLSLEMLSTLDEADQWKWYNLTNSRLMIAVGGKVVEQAATVVEMRMEKNEVAVVRTVVEKEVTARPGQ